MTRKTATMIARSDNPAPEFAPGAAITHRNGHAGTIGRYCGNGFYDFHTTTGATYTVSAHEIALAPHPAPAPLPSLPGSGAWIIRSVRRDENGTIRGIVEDAPLRMAPVKPRHYSAGRTVVAPKP